MSGAHELVRTQFLPRPLDEVFAFFADAQNLEKITPAFLGFRILTPAPIAMHPGALIRYRLKLFGIPFGWTTRIEEFVPRLRFVDVQLAGPYRAWRHEHTFAAVPGGTLVTDRVTYELPLGPLGGLAHALFVRRTLAVIFDFRKARIAAIFNVPERDAPPEAAPCSP